LRSLRLYLLGWLLGALSLGGVLMVLGAYLLALDELDEIFDAQLRQIALSAITHYQRADAEVLRQRIEAFQFITQVWTRNGILVFASQRYSPISFVGAEGFRTEKTASDTLRVYTAVYPDFVVQAAQPIEVRRTLAAQSARRLIIPILAAIPLISGLLWYASARGLFPVRRAAREIESRSEVSLAPLDPQRYPVELGTIVEAVNRLMERLGAALALQKQFVADAAHELRTPVTALRLNARMLDRAPTPEARQEAAVALQASVLRTQRLVEQLLALSRAEPGATVHDTEVVDLSALARGAVAEFSPRADEVGIDLGAQAEGSAYVLGDAEQLRVLVNNLIDNALRYTPAGGTVDVLCEAQGESVTLSVRDRGPGIAPEERARVFDRFYRGSAAHDERSPAAGSGLGLAIVKAICERHAARIELTDNAASSGLVVRVTFARRPGASDQGADRS
jgi:two-component system OmpR family sensor kinase